MSGALANSAYLLASVLFIVGIKGLTHPRTAVRGNGLSALGMLIAVVVTLLLGGISYGVIIAAVVIGAAIGAVAAVKVPMTAMPQMVALLNGLGGGASVGVAGAELINGGGGGPWYVLIAIALAGLIGSVTFLGSFVAFGKLQGLGVFRKPLVLPMQQAVNAVLGLAAIGLTAWIVIDPAAAPWAFLLLILLAAVLGLTLTSPIGGADMPVVIALLNSYSGLAAAAAGFAIGNQVLVITGALVGASGLILTSIMCKAMNRSLANVLFGGIDASAAGATEDEVYEGKIKSTTADEVAMMLDGARRVVVVPGYGMAVAQAQHAVRDLAGLLEENGAKVEFAIHPVAGRMPGHMNVLLAEVDVPYDKLVEMDRINPEFEQVDVVIVLGANDVVNPDAREDPSSPIAGMPILNVDHAQTVVVVKRSLSAGFAGIPNPLFAADNTLMYFGDAKKAMQDLVTAVKEN